MQAHEVVFEGETAGVVLGGTPPVLVHGVTPPVALLVGELRAATRAVQWQYEKRGTPGGYSVRPGETKC